MFPPLTEERLTAVMDELWRLWEFPNCFGALDGKHCILQVRKLFNRESSSAPVSISEKNITIVFFHCRIFLREPLTG